MRTWAIVALLAAAAQFGCAPEGPAGPGDEVIKVTMEQGGACPGTDPCWWRTAVIAPGTIRLENFKQSFEAQLMRGDFERVVEVVNRPQFRAAMASERPVCPVTFDADIYFTLETSHIQRTDKHASGCVLNTEDVAKHPYRDLFKLLDALRRQYFPGVLPF